MTILEEIFRIDSILLTILGGAIIGSLVQCADYHTIAHGPIRAFVIAAGTGGIAGFLGGCIGRGVGSMIFQKSKTNSIPRWIGNVLAFAGAAAIIPVFALA